MEADVVHGLDPMGGSFTWPWSRVSGAQDGENGVRFIYLGEHQPVVWSSGLPTDSDDYDVDVIDTWNMTVMPGKKIAAPIPYPTRHGAIIRGGKPDAAFGVELPGKPRLALRVRQRK
jgi:hypothetical protein